MEVVASESDSMGSTDWVIWVDTGTCDACALMVPSSSKISSLSTVGVAVVMSLRGTTSVGFRFLL